MVLFFSLSQAGTIDKAYAALKEYDYFKAKKCFYKALKRQKAAASYGLSQIFYRTDNPFHNFDSAFKYIEVCIQSYQWLSLPQKTELEKKFALSQTTISEFRYVIHQQTYLHLNKNLHKKTITGIDSFLLMHPDFFYKEILILQRDSMAFSGASEINTSTAYHRFMLDYPESYFLAQARAKQEKSFYFEQTSKNLPAEFERFIEKYPGNKYAREAENSIFMFYLEKKDIKKLHESILKFPKNKHVNAAWKLIYRISVPEYSPGELEKFLEKYPDFPYKNGIEQEIALSELRLFPIKQEGRYGFIDSTGTPYVLPFLDGIEEFSEGLCVAEFKGHYGYINKTGETIIPFKYDNAESFRHGLAVVQLNNKSLLIDRNGNTIVQGYDEIADFNEGLAIVSKGGKYGAIDYSGNIAINLQYEKMGDFYNGVAFVVRNGKYGYIDKPGNFITESAFEWVESFVRNLARFKINGKYGLMKPDGSFVLPAEYDRIEPTANNIFLLVKGDKYGFMDASGCRYTELIYLMNKTLNIVELTDGNYLKIISKEGQNLMDKNGKKFFSGPEPDKVFLPKNGFIRVVESRKFGFVAEKKGSFAPIKAVYDDATDFNDEGVAIVTKRNKVMLIDVNGKVLFTAKDGHMAYMGQGLYKLELEEGISLMDKQGELLLNDPLSKVERITTGILRVEKNGKMAYFDQHKREYIWKEKGFD